MASASFNCKQCKDKKCLTTGEPCKVIEGLLRKNGIKGKNWIRPEVSRPKREKDEHLGWMARYREVPMGDGLEKYATRKAMELKYGKRPPTQVKE